MEQTPVGKDCREANLYVDDICEIINMEEYRKNHDMDFCFCRPRKFYMSLIGSLAKILKRGTGVEYVSIQATCPICQNQGTIGIWGKYLLKVPPQTR